MSFLISKDFAPYDMAVRYNLGGRIKIDIEVNYDRPTELGKVLLWNEIKRLGIFELSRITFASLPPRHWIEGR
jgi:hypothetical protein